MKIVCDACSAKYSIADDKVKGKVFKIRCKKCSNIIVVRGTAGGAAEEPAAPQFDQKDTRVYDYGYDEGAAAAPGAEAAGDAEAVWHLVIDQEQVGPLTVAEVQEKFNAGQIDAESYVWREGFADWQPLSAVDAFAGVLSGAAAAPAPSGGSSGRDAVASMFGAPSADEQGTVRSDPGDLFGAPRAAAAPVHDEAPADDAGDLFGARAAASAPASSAPADEPRSRTPRDTGGKLRGERNENSVLFSLGNLAALASDAPRASASSSSSSSSSASSSSSGGTAQHGGSEGSGLIDIRSMATAYLGDKGGGSQKKAPSSVGSIDDLPVFSHAAFAEPAVIMPTAGGRQNNKTMIMLIGAVGALAVITLILVLVVVLGGKSGGGNNQPAGGSQVASVGGSGTGSNKVEGTTPGSETKPPDGTGSGTETTTAGTGSGTETTTAGTGSGTEAGSSTGTGTAGTGSGTNTGSSTSHKPTGGDKPTGGHKPEKPDKPDKPDKPTPPPVETGGKCMDEVGCLLAEKPPACCSKYSKKKPPKDDKPKDPVDNGGGGDLPESLDSGMIKDGVGKVKSKILACGDKYPSAKGTLKLSVKVSPAGGVTEASAVQSPDPGLGSCAASAVKGAKFAKTQRGGSFKYPFNF